MDERASTKEFGERQSINLSSAATCSAFVSKNARARHRPEPERLGAFQVEPGSLKGTPGAQ